MKLTTTIEKDDLTLEITRPFDYPFTGTVETEIQEPQFPVRDGTWKLGVIVGPSGRGKTSLLKKFFGEPEYISWFNHQSIAANFSSSGEAIGRLGAVGLNSVPTWCKPFQVLSDGEKFRARLARQLKTNASIDEYTSVVDRVVAKSASVAMSRYIRQVGFTGLVLATCHYDVLEWLSPDWVYDTLTETMSLRGCLRRPEIKIRIHAGNRGAWKMFRDHHYLNTSLCCSARCFLARWDEVLVGFASAIAMPCGTVKNAWREHRTVVLPEYQGLGIGPRLSDWVGQHFVSQGKRYFSRTAHPRLGDYRMRSPLWKPTSKNGIRRKDYESGNNEGKIRFHNYQVNPLRICYSHEFIGDNPAPNHTDI